MYAHPLNTYTNMLFTDRSRLTGERVVRHEDYADWISSEFMSSLFPHGRMPSEELQNFANKYTSVLAQHLRTLMDAHDRILSPRPSITAQIEFVDKMVFDPKDCYPLVEPDFRETVEHEDYFPRSKYEREYINYIDNLLHIRELSLNRVLNIVIGSALLAERDNPVGAINSTNILIQMVKTGQQPESLGNASDMLFQIQSAAEFLVKSRIVDIATESHAALTAHLAVLYPSIPFLRADIRCTAGNHQGLVIALHCFASGHSSFEHVASWTTESEVADSDKLPADKLSFATLLALLNEDSLENDKSNRMGLFTFVGALYDNKSPMVRAMYRIYASQLATAAENYPYPVASDIATLKRAVK